MDTIGMDTYAFVAGVAAAALSVVTRHVRMVPAGSGGRKPSSGALWDRHVVRQTTVK